MVVVRRERVGKSGLMADRLTTGPAQAPRRRSAVSRVLGFVLAFTIAGVATGVVLWLGGVSEILVSDIPPDGPSCTLVGDSDQTDEGTEVAEWVGGGLFGRPGRVCELDGYQQRVVTVSDVVFAAIAALTFVLVAVLLCVRWAGIWTTSRARWW